MNAHDHKKIRVLVVDDSAFIRRALIMMFNGNSDIQVIDVASNGEMAVARVKELRPDVVTLDVKMPVLDGLSALERIMKECPTPVIMLSSLTEKGGDNALKALELGAVDFVDKSSAGGPMDIAALASGLIAKIMIAARVDVGKLKGAEEEKFSALKAPVLAAKRETEVVVIGASTGGPPALQAVLTKIPENIPCPILIVQHMPVGFTASLADRLNRLCALSVKEAVDDEPIKEGTAYIAPAGMHLKLKRLDGELRIRLDLFPESTLHRPSVDVLLESAAAVCGGKTLAFVLTGMGKDGASGAKAIKNAGGRIFVESEESSIVFGMPKAVMDSVCVDGVVPLEAVVDTLVKMI